MDEYVCLTVRSRPAEPADEFNKRLIAFWSGMIRGRKEEYDRFREHTVFKRFGEPSHVAAAIGYLCSEEAGYITGTVLEVMGGMNLLTASLRA